MTAIGRSVGSQLEDEIESWKGFPWAMRKEDRELWDQMINEVRQHYAGAVELSGKPLTTDPFFMVLILAQQRTIERLRAQLFFRTEVGTEARREVPYCPNCGNVVEVEDAHCRICGQGLSGQAPQVTPGGRLFRFSCSRCGRERVVTEEKIREIDWNGYTPHCAFCGSPGNLTTA